MGIKLALQLISNATGPGQSAPQTIPESGHWIFMASGTFTGPITLQILGPDGTTYIPYTAAASLAAAGSVALDLPAGAQVRTNMAAANTGMYASLAFAGET